MKPTAINPGRRNFLTGRRLSSPDRVRPPWTRAASVDAACSGCGACVPACPQHIIALDEFRPACAGFHGRGMQLLRRLCRYMPRAGVRPRHYRL
ncbi:4Fe-4S binding protein [Bosea thiooxidans]